MDLVLFRSWQSARGAGAVSLARKLLGKLVVGEAALIDRCARKITRGDLEDLRQMGAFGVMSALEKFDPARGAWTSFAKQYIAEAMNKGVVGPKGHGRIRGKGDLVRESQPDYRVGHGGETRELMTKERRQLARAIEARTGVPATAAELGVSEEILEAAQNKSRPSVSYDEADIDNHASAGAYGALLAAATVPSGDAPMKALYYALGVLTNQEESIVYAVVVAEKSVKEIAYDADKSEWWVRARLESGLAKLRQEMTKTSAVIPKVTAIQTAWQGSRRPTLPATPPHSASSPSPR